jgi:hypothetical protein
MMRRGDEELLWSGDLLILSNGEKTRGRLSILTGSMIIEERSEKVMGDPAWRNPTVMDLPSPDDVRLSRRGLFNKVLTINWKDKDIELFSDDLSKIFEEIRTAITVATNLKPGKSNSVLSLVGKTGSAVLN